MRDAFRTMNIDYFLNRIDLFFFNMDLCSVILDAVYEVLRIIWMDYCLHRVSYVIKLQDILLILNYTSFGVSISNDFFVGGHEASRNNTKARYCTRF
jgi:hypothetical protein